jgi:hypothetical protein
LGEVLYQLGEHRVSPLTPIGELDGPRAAARAGRHDFNRGFDIAVVE